MGLLSESGFKERIKELRKLALDGGKRCELTKILEELSTKYMSALRLPTDRIIISNKGNLLPEVAKENESTKIIPSLPLAPHQSELFSYDMLSASDLQELAGGIKTPFESIVGIITGKIDKSISPEYLKELSLDPEFMHSAKNEKISVKGKELTLIKILEEATKLGKDYNKDFSFLVGPHRLAGHYEVRVFDEVDWSSCLIISEPETPKTPKPNHKKKKVIGI